MIIQACPVLLPAVQNQALAAWMGSINTLCHHFGLSLLVLSWHDAFACAWVSAAQA